MNTKIVFAELVEEACGITSPDKRKVYHREVIYGYIAMAFAEYLYAIFRKNSSELDKYVKVYKDVKVLKDCTTNTYYSELPEEIVELPNNESIRRIGYMKDKMNYMIPISIGQEEFVNNTDLSIIHQEIGYRLMGNRIEYAFISEPIDNLLMHLVIPFNKYDKNDIIPIPSGKISAIVNSVKDLILNRPPKDLANDGN